MNYNTEEVDNAVLALLFLTLHDDNRAWKGFDWDALNRLHEKGYIENPRNQNKSIALTPEGRKRSEELFKNMFQAKG